LKVLERRYNNNTMYTKQIGFSLLAGVAAGAVLFSSGYDAFAVSGGGLLVFVTLRWGIAWAYRVRYWYSRGTRNFSSRTCPNCGQYIHRKSGDWILTCHNCGWKPGLPILRWLTKSVPAIQLKRTLGGQEVLLLPIALSLLTISAVGVGGVMSPGTQHVEEINETVTVPNETVVVDESGEIVNETTAREDNGEDESTTGYNQTKVERLIFAYTNEERKERGLSALDYREDVAKAAREHSGDMAEKGEIYHGDIQSRYSCPRGFGENTAWKDTVITTNEELARGIVTGWMNSPGHRKNILRERYGSIGVGVYKTREDVVYATQGFCSK